MTMRRRLRSVPSPSAPARTAARWLAPLLLLLLTACASSPGIPENTWYRLPAPPPPPTPAAQPLLSLPVVVDTLLADGLHSEQALLYALGPGGAQLRTYHYQLWIDPPVRMLQRRLIDFLRSAGASALVVDRLPAAATATAARVSGRIERFERVPDGDGWKGVVALTLRVDVAGQERPLLVRSYSESVPAADNTVAASVDSLGTAVDRVFAAFFADLAAAANATDGGAPSAEAGSGDPTGDGARG